MRKRSLITVFTILAATVQAQYITPGTGINWTFDDLAQNSAGAVSQEPSGSYTVHEDLTIAAGDTLSVPEATDVSIENGILVTVQGTLIADPPDDEIVFFKALDDHYTGFRFEDRDDSFLKNVYFKKAGGIKLVNADIFFESCDFTEFSQDHSTGTLDLFESAPQIINCSSTTIRREILRQKTITGAPPIPIPRRCTFFTSPMIRSLGLWIISRYTIRR